MFNIKKYLKFFILLITRGNLRSRKTDFELKRKNTLGKLPREVLPIRSEPKKTVYRKLRYALLDFEILGPIIENIAFFKNWKGSLTKLYIDDSSKLAYLRIYKCASTSVLSGLLPKIHTPLSGQPLTNSEIDSIAHYLEVKTIDSRLTRYSYFTIVRNPLERIVSAYIDILEEGDYGNFLFGIFQQKMKFKEVLKILKDIPDHLRGPHFTSQSRIIQLFGNKNLRVFKLKEESSDIAQFLSQYDISLTHSNKSSKSYNYMDYYDKESMCLVRTIYENDFVDFGYDQEFNRSKKLLESNQVIHKPKPT